MGSLEDKIAGLSPEDRRAAEQFIDYLLMKSATAAAVSPSSLPFMAADPARIELAPCIIAPDLHPSPAPQAGDRFPLLGDLRIRESPNNRDDQVLQEHPRRKDPGLLLDWID